MKNRHRSPLLSLSLSLSFFNDEERRKRTKGTKICWWRRKDLDPARRNDRGQFVDVIDENASHSEASESVERSSGRPVVIFNFSIKAQVGRLMVATCSSGYFDSGSHS